MCALVLSTGAMPLQARQGWRRVAFALAIMILGTTAHAAPLGSAFTYQGQLKEGGLPATGLYDLQFCLFDTPSTPIPLACASDADNVPVDGGLFAVTLDFGSAPFSGQERFLELRVRPGASGGGYTLLAPRQLLRPAPEALRANLASAAPWAGLSGMPAGFADGSDDAGSGTVTSISAGSGLSGGTITASGTLSVDFASVHPRITSSLCPVGTLLSHVNGATLDCGNSIVGGSGVTATPSASASGTTVTLGTDSTVQRRNTPPSCTVGEVLRVIGADGTPTCVAALTSVTGGGGISATTVGSAVTLGTDGTVQRRSVAPACQVGQVIRELAEDGTPTCVAPVTASTTFGNIPTLVAGPIEFVASTNVVGFAGQTFRVSVSAALGADASGGSFQLAMCYQASSGTITLAGSMIGGLTLAPNQRQLFTLEAAIALPTADVYTVGMCGAFNSPNHVTNNDKYWLTISN